MKLQNRVGSEECSEPTRCGERGFRGLRNPRAWVQGTSEPTLRGFRSLRMLENAAYVPCPSGGERAACESASARESRAATSLLSQRGTATRTGNSLCTVCRPRRARRGFRGALSLAPSLSNSLSSPLTQSFGRAGMYNTKAAEAAEAVSLALEAGVRSIDTASMYGNEKEVGSAWRAR